MPEGERTRTLAELTDEQAEALLWDWDFWCRPSQREPAGDWRIWLVKAGRGYGKTRVGTEWVRRHHKHYARMNLVGRTAGDVRDIMVDGESGILRLSPPYERPKYEPSKRRLTWPNGAVASLFSSDEPEALRGPQCHGFWCDELAAWRNAVEVWSNLMFGFRLGVNPRGVITTTPRPTKLIKKLLADATVIVTSGSTYENAANLSPAFLAQVVAPYEGTRLGRQELEGEIVEDLEGALWSSARIHELRVEEAPELERVVVGIDPGTGTGEDAGETGIVVAGRGRDGHAYVLSDKSLRASPDAWARQAIVAYHQYHADRIIAERNQGGDMVEHTLRTVDPAMPFKAVTASRGKATRAEPIAALYEQGKVHHVGAHAKLEDQMCSWVPGMTSPDRMDACLVAGTGVLTERGLVAIECVNVGDRVLTRRGYRSVTWAGMTHRVAHTLTVEFSNAAVLRGTAEHPVWVRGHGWMPLGELRQGDLVQACDYEMKLSLGESGISGFPIRPISINGATTGRRAAAARTLCTVRSGKHILGQSPMVGTFITEIATHSITTSPIWPRCLLPRIVGNTKGSLQTFSAGPRITLESLPLCGMVLPRAWDGIGNMAGRLGGIASPNSSPAPTAGGGLCAISPREIAYGSVANSVPELPQTGNTVITKSQSALSAAGRSSSVSTAPNQKLAPVYVARSYANSAAPVYNLHIDGVHEFYANGILVHNCVWALTELMLGHAPINLTGPWDTTFGRRVNPWRA